MSDPLLRRAGLDYHEYVDVRTHRSWPEASPYLRPATDGFATGG